MNDDDLKRIEKMIRDNRTDSSGESLILLLILLCFINGCFKGFGY